MPKKSSYHHDESVLVKNPELVKLISGLLRVTEETLLAAMYVFFIYLDTLY